MNYIVTETWQKNGARPIKQKSTMPPQKSSFFFTY